MFVWVAMTVVMVGVITRGPSPPAVIAISLRGLSSIKHAQKSLMTSGAESFCRPGIQNYSSAILCAAAAYANFVSTFCQRLNAYEGRQQHSQGW